MPVNDLARWREGEVAEILELVRNVCESGTFMLGPATKGFETALSEFVGCTHVIPVANGTDALTLALLGVGVCNGDSVITAANAGGYTSTAAIRIGARPVPVDVPAGGCATTRR